MREPLFLFIFLFLPTLDCFSCPPGREGTYCSQCKKGHFKAEWGNFSCQPCTDGSYTSETGSTVCKYCESGTFASHDKTHCVECPPNTVSPKGASGIQECIAQAGYFALPSRPGTMCPAGYYCPLGIMQPIKCPKHTESTAGSTQCVARKSWWFFFT